jgi:CxxC motif-containing protein (DUF1111 family)
MVGYTSDKNYNFVFISHRTGRSLIEGVAQHGGEGNDCKRGSNRRTEKIK